ncbi:hypothetical protein [Micromonospora inyonensis]|uniref:Protein kinase domain-containing protein n=1 Tax=Micromonospora inyonensis TaxID=47866 RepID=A0A1C6RPW8_9ACTN|nr:hypothetical protein [Micromonospora inyonensis]SCL19222.1 hypothetical protein GA0074694_2611 [Micromonospora inyonensis]
MTLYEMATGTLPKWGENANPAAVSDEVTLDPAAFDPAVADRMVEFFARALARDAARRFDTVDDMTDAWRAIFQQVPQSAPTLAAAGRPAVGLNRSSPLAAAELTARARSALERLGTATLLAELRALGIPWEAIVAADNGSPTDADFRSLTELVQHHVVPAVSAAVAAADGPVLLTEAAPLVRYGQLRLLQELADPTRPRPAARLLLGGGPAGRTGAAGRRAVAVDRPGQPVGLAGRPLAGPGHSMTTQVTLRFRGPRPIAWAGW